MAWLDRESAKCLNELLDRAEALWSSDHYSAVVLHDAQSVIGKLVYLFVNVVRAGLVRSYRDWPGVTSTPRDWMAQPQAVARPELHFNQSNERWAEVLVRYTVPPALRDRDLEVLVASVEAAIAEREREICSDARRAGVAFVGVERCRKQSPFDFPKTPALDSG